MQEGAARSQLPVRNMANVYSSMAAATQYRKFLNTELMAIVYDLETTGLNPAINHPIQVAARLCAVSPYGLDEICSQSWYINPGYQLPQKIVELTGITDRFLATQPKESEVIREIVGFFENYPVIGYNNGKFDDLFMQQMYQRYGYAWKPKMSMDIYALVKTLFNPGQLKNQKLVTLAEHFQVTDQIEAFHNAESDTLATILVANKCLDLCKPAEVTGNGATCKVKSVRYYEHPKNWKVKRIYVDTDITRFYFDVTSMTWNPVYDDDLISQYNMQDVIRQVLHMTGCKDEVELAAYKG